MAKLPKRDREKVDERILALADNPRPHGAIILKGTDHSLWRVHAGDYRILYEIKNQQLVVVIVDVGNRRDVYRNL